MSASAIPRGLIHEGGGGGGGGEGVLDDTHNANIVIIYIDILFYRYLTIMILSIHSSPL